MSPLLSTTTPEHLGFTIPSFGALTSVHASDSEEDPERPAHTFYPTGQPCEVSPAWSAPSHSARPPGPAPAPFLPNSAPNSAAFSGFGRLPVYRNFLTPKGFRRRATACPGSEREQSGRCASTCTGEQQRPAPRPCSPRQSVLPRARPRGSGCAAVAEHVAHGGSRCCHHSSAAPHARSELPAAEELCKGRRRTLNLKLP